MKTCAYFYLKKKEGKDYYNSNFLLSIFYVFLYFGAVKEKEETHRQTHSNACKNVQLFRTDHRKKELNVIVQNLDYKQFLLDNVWVSFVLEIDFPVSNGEKNKLFLTLMAYLNVKKFRHPSWSWLSYNAKFSGMQKPFHNMWHANLI